MEFLGYVAVGLAIALTAVLIYLIRLSGEVSSLKAEVNKPFTIQDVIEMVKKLDKKFGAEKVDQDVKGGGGTYLSASLEAVLGKKFDVSKSGNAELSKLKSLILKMHSSLNAYLENCTEDIKDLLREIESIKEAMITRQMSVREDVNGTKDAIAEVVRALELLDQEVKVALDIPTIEVVEDIDVALDDDIEEFKPELETEEKPDDDAGDEKK